ncbi:Farnesyl diphosphate synthase [Grimontia hollisae]|uniref:Farnesyl diphosphate synthase n=1 Tax=Grimontia hollisae TaxID=673 RepID=A0A377J950_GRIHO|nr:Farnesyl diphosphate synthase [Grimontia hollisae]
MVKELAAASGAAGMCLGQALDLSAEGKKVDVDTLETIHRNKTGALIRCAVRLGALAAGKKGPHTFHSWIPFSNAIGLAFQVQDDILDIISDTETLGKPQGSDIAAEKSTYPALLGLGARNRKQCFFIKKHYKRWMQSPTIQSNWKCSPGISSSARIKISSAKTNL